MPAIQPSGSVSLSSLNSALGRTASSSVNGLRGANQTLPASGSLSFSQARKILYGVGFINSWITPTANTSQGLWSDTGYSDTSKMTISYWLYISSTNGNWRNVFHFTPSQDGWRRPAAFIAPSSYYLHICMDTSVVGNENTNTTSLTQNAKTHVVHVYNGNNMKTYFNGSLNAELNMSGTPSANDSTVNIFIVNNWYSTGGFQINKFFVYPYSMSAAQVTTLYNNQVGSV